ncbi:hypothetical protein NP284_35875 [Rhodopseudomonas pseudopalustris]|uniref:hypothetical protein n=1 Tax=Rhodopseudomonas pseudopalustris TaxID=1513892 RepID=UPI003F992CC7
MNIAAINREEIQDSAPNGISYFTTKSFDKALHNVLLSGGQAKKRGLKVKIVLGSLKDDDPFDGLPVTNNGETRIKNCVKYDLGDGWRLVTRQTDKICTFLYVGDHDTTDRWLESHKGELVGVDKERRLVRVPGTGGDPIARSSVVEQHTQPLVDMLGEESSDSLLESLPPSLARKFAGLDGGCSIKDIDALLGQVTDQAKGDLLRKVFCLLLDGNVDGAKAHVDLSTGNIEPVEFYDANEIMEVIDGEDVRRIKVGSPEYEEWVQAFEKRSAWHEWFLFLHPEQEAVVNADYPGTSQLSGVSGSGKTCVAVRRALRLARKDGAKVLLLTLNRSLAGLLRQLVDMACPDQKVRDRIEVTSFFELANRCWRRSNRRTLVCMRTSPGRPANMSMRSSANTIGAGPTTMTPRRC